MSSAKRCIVCGGAVEKEDFRVDFIEEKRAMSCGGIDPAGTEIEEV